MEGLRIFKNLKSKKILIIIFWIICCFITTNVNKVKAQEEQLTDPFMATLTIQRTDCIQTDSAKKASLEFGFANSIQLIPVPPGPPAECIKAFFDHDPNITGFASMEEDSNQPQFIKDLNSLLDSGRDSCDGWQRAIFLLPDPEPDQQWKATWGVKISYPELLPYDPNIHPIEISWDPNKLASGPLELQIGDTKINMHEHSLVTKDIADKSIIKIVYGDTPPPSITSVLGIICVGGKINEARRRGNFMAFTHLGDWTYKNLCSKIPNPKENIRFIFYEGYHDINGDKFNYNFSDNTLNQKEKIKTSIVDWVWGKWKDTIPKKAVLVIYLIDHGTPDGQIYIDPYDSNNQMLTSQELDEFIDDLEDKLSESPIPQYEILIMLEACYSESFFNAIRPDDPNQPNYRIFIASATKESEISYLGIDSFSHYFWEKIGNEQYTIQNAFHDTKSLFEGQIPFFWPEKPPRGKTFLFDDWYAIQDSPIIIPNIIAVETNLENIDHFGYKAEFLVYADRPINRAWAAIITPECSNDWCRFYSDSNELYPLESDSNIISFSPNYYFYTPNTVVCVYVQGDKTEVSGPYYMEPDFLEDYISISTDPNTLLDEYEPDNEPKEVKKLAGKLQVHSFHDSNDVDWVKFIAFPDTTYNIQLILLSPLTIDPNIIPFQLTIFTPEGKIENEDVEFKKIFRDYIYENIHIDNKYIYIKKWKSPEDESETIYLKIQPKVKYNSPFIYWLHITPVMAGENFYIFSGVNIETKDKIKNKILNLYLVDEGQNQFLPIWIKSNLIDENYRCDPKYFYFHLQKEHSQSFFCNLYMGGERRGPDENIYVSQDTNFIIWLDPNLYFTDMERPEENCDHDCDGRFDPYEPSNGMSPNCREIILHSGMNVFHYPFWATCYDKTKEIPAVNLYNIFYNPIETFYDPNITDLIKICTFSEKENAWLCYNDQNSSEIFLNNTSGCLIYLNSTNKKIISLSDDIESDYTKFGNCFRDALSCDPNNAKIELHTGLNIVGLIGYKTLFDIDPFISVSDGYFNSFSASYSLAETSSGSNPMSFSSIMRYDHNQGKWQNSSLFFSRATGKKFTIQPDEGYLIYMANEGDQNSLEKIIWMPHQTRKDLDYKLIGENE